MSSNQITHFENFRDEITSQHGESYNEKLFFVLIRFLTAIDFFNFNISNKTDHMRK